MDAFPSGALMQREQLVEQAWAADKVVIGGRWFALIDGELVCGPVHGATMYLNEADPVALGHNVDEDSDLGIDARRAELMLGATMPTIRMVSVTSGGVTREVPDTDRNRAEMNASLNPAALEAARAFAAGLDMPSLEVGGQP